MIQRVDDIRFELKQKLFKSLNNTFFYFTFKFIFFLFKTNKYPSALLDTFYPLYKT